MVSDDAIRSLKSIIVLLCILNYIFLPWDALALGYVQNFEWKSLALYIFMEQSLILATRKMIWYSIIFQTLSAVSILTYLQLYNDPLMGKARAEKLGASTVLTAFVVLDAARNAGMAVLASNISRTIHSRQDLYLKISGLGVIALVNALSVFVAPKETPLVATFASLSRGQFQLLYGFLCLRMLFSTPFQSMTVAITRQGDLRMIFQRMAGGFDMDRLIPETKGDVYAKDLEENRVRLRLNLNAIFVGCYIIVVITKGAL